MNLALIGFGNVGRGFAQILMDKGADLAQKEGFVPRVVAIVTSSRGVLFDPNGLDLPAALDAYQKGSFEHYPASESLHREMNAQDICTHNAVEAIIETTPTDLETAQPALDHCRWALGAGKHVVTANKGPAALHWQTLSELAAQNSAQIGIEGTVMSGTPAMQLAMNSLAGCTFNEIRGILNGTTNYILTQMENGHAYADALKAAQDLGYAEPDPTADVEGYDAMSKVLILANVVMGGSLTPADISVTGISALTPDDIAAAHAAGKCYKLIGRVVRKEGKIDASVAPVRVPLSDPLASIGGATNAITYSTDLMGDVTLIGAGAGRTETGFSLLSDLLAIHRRG